MPLYLNVPYSQKEEAKARGARWNPALKKWYVTERSAYRRVLEWIDGAQVVCNQIYLVEGLHTCFRCKRQTPVIGFGFETYYEIDGDTIEYWSEEIHIGNLRSQLPEKLAGELKKRYGYYWGYSKTTQSYDYGNHCRHCDVLQGNFYVFDEVDSPFYIDGPDAAKKLVLHRIRLPQDIAVTADIGYGSEDFFIKQCARMVDSDLRWE